VVRPDREEHQLARRVLELHPDEVLRRLPGQLAAGDPAGAPLPPAECADVDRIAAAARSALGQDAFAAESAWGRGLRPDEARALAGCRPPGRTGGFPQADSGGRRMCRGRPAAKAGDMPLADLTAVAGWAYLLLALVVALDAVLPLVPSEVALIGAGALVATGVAEPVPLLAAGWLGALAGDLTSYGLGRRAGRFGVGRLLRHRRGRSTLVWATRQLDRRTVPVLVAGRFLPGGRTVTTLTAGFLRIPPDRFVPAVALGGALWAAYVVGLGYLGGKGAAEQPWAGALAGLLLATAAGFTVEGVRRVRARAETDPEPPVSQPRGEALRGTSSATCS